ncbi:ParB/RepB/Spo0J family partition protein [Cetobacterium ceti]
MDLKNNPLSKRENSFQSIPKVDKTLIEKYGEIKNINYKFFEKIDLEDKTFINRLDKSSEIVENENFKGLVESIKKIGLINPIYLLEKDNGKYIIISGWRRSLSLNEIYKENKEKIFREKAIIFSSETPLNILENISIDENTKRKDLSILELSYKFNKMSENNNYSIEECLEKFNIGKSQFHAIKKAIDFQDEVKNILEEVGVVKGDLINKILKYNKQNKKINLNDLALKTREELKEFLKNIKEKNKIKEKYSIREGKEKTTIVIKKDLSDKILKEIIKLIEEN